MSINSQSRRLAQLLARLDQKIVFAESCTGGLVAGALTKIPGISQHLCGGMVVYRNETKTAYLGISPEVLKKPGPVSEQVAREMAESVLAKTPEATIAAAVTGHLGPKAPKRLDGVVFIAVSRRNGLPETFVHRLKLPADDSREVRQKEVVEAVLDTVMAVLEADAALEAEETHVCTPDCEHHHPVHLSQSGSTTEELSPADWQQLLRGEVHAICLGGATVEEERLTSGAIFPGSFNPLHEGHNQMAAYAEKTLGVSVEFAISIENVDKPTISRREILRRAKQFRPEQAIWVVSAATFVELATLFPDTTFLVGIDTIARVGDVKYYENDPRRLRVSLQYLTEQGAEFLVFGRVLEGKFCTLADLKLPAGLRKLCRGVSEREFHQDVSSSAARGTSKKAARS